MNKNNKQSILKLNELINKDKYQDDFSNITSYSESFAGYNFFNNDKLIKYIKYSEIDNNKQLLKYLRENYNQSIYEKNSKIILIFLFVIYFLLIISLLIIFLNYINNKNILNIYYVLFLFVIIISNIIIFIKRIKITFIVFSLIDNKINIETLFRKVKIDMKDIDKIEYKPIIYLGQPSRCLISIYYNNKQIKIEFYNYSNFNILKKYSKDYNINLKEIN